MSEFGYPQDLLEFLPFFPPQDGYDPSVHTQDERVARLIDIMKQYLGTKTVQFG